MTDELAPFDRKILDLAADGYSPQEISDQLNGTMSAAAVAKSIRDMLAAQSGYLNVMEGFALLLHDAQRIKARLIDMLDQEDGVRAGTALVNLLQIIGQRLDAAAAQSGEVEGKIKESQAREFAAILELMYDSVVRRLRDMYPEVGEREMRQIIAEEMPRAVERVNSLVIE